MDLTALQKNTIERERGPPSRRIGCWVKEDEKHIFL
jgi:hypothetical protein